MTDHSKIPFDLAKALAGERCVTRDGREAKVIFEDDTVSPVSASRIWTAIKEDGQW